MNSWSNIVQNSGFSGFLVNESVFVRIIALRFWWRFIISNQITSFESHPNRGMYSNQGNEFSKTSYLRMNSVRSIKPSSSFEVNRCFKASV